MPDPRDFPQSWYDAFTLEDLHAYLTAHGWTAGEPLRVNPNVDCTSRDWVAPDNRESFLVPDRSGAFTDDELTKWWAIRRIAITESRSRAEVLLDLAALTVVPVGALLAAPDKE